jgi:hypothetical protein
MTKEHRRPGPTVKQLCEGVRPDNPVEHIIVCPVCGQMFDCRSQADAAHHMQDNHTPRRPA